MLYNSRQTINLPINVSEILILDICILIFYQKYLYSYRYFDIIMYLPKR